MSHSVVGFGIFWQDKNDMYSSLYTIKWFMQCFLDRVSSMHC